MASCAGTTPTSPMAFSRASTAWSRLPRPRLEATDQPATSRRSSTSSPASSNSAYPPETARSHVKLGIAGHRLQLRLAGALHPPHGGEGFRHALAERQHAVVAQDAVVHRADGLRQRVALGRVALRAAEFVVGDAAVEARRRLGQ